MNFNFLLIKTNFPSVRLGAGKFKILLLVLAIFILTATGFVIFRYTNQDSLESMITFTDPKGRFSVLMPGEPKEITGKNMEEYTVQTWDTQYTVKIVEGNDVNSEINTIMRIVGGNAKLIYADSFRDASELPYVDYKVTNDNKIAQGRIFLVQNTLYILLEVAPIQDHDDSRFNNFRSSFTLN